MSKLSNVSCYVTEKISVDSIDISEYITTDNLLQNKKGRVIAEKLPTQKVTRFKKNDILIANIRPYLKKIWQADIDGGASSDVLVVRPNDVIDNNFLYYALTQDSFFEYVMKGSKGTKMPRGDKSQIMDFVIPDLEIDEQIKIGKLLKSIDQKIQINNQINQELEAMAKTLYDYWFVQFDFPDQNGEPYKSSEGKMVYNPELKREIPEGWGVASIRDFESNIITGKTPSRTNSDNFGGEIPFITIGDIRGNTYIYRTSETLTDLGASVQKNKYLPEESLCVSCIATVGEIGFTTEPSHTNQQINSIVFEDETNRYYLYFALKNYFENANASAKTGNTFANMNKEDFSGIRIILPRNEIKNNFHKMTEPYFAQIKCLQGQNQELTQLRDWLLPMLMNGQGKVE